MKYTPLRMGHSKEILRWKRWRKNLVEMNSELMRSQRSMSNGFKSLSPAERQLKNLCEECDVVSRELLAKLDTLKVRSQSWYKRWDSLRQALRSMWNEGELRALEKRLEGIRTRLDTNLLICLRYVIL